MQQSRNKQAGFACKSTPGLLILNVQARNFDASHFFFACFGINQPETGQVRVRLKFNPPTGVFS
jgi:hypothetical protein